MAMDFGISEVNSFGDSKIAEKLDQWMKQYNLACQLLKQINKCFGLILLITTANDFIVSIQTFDKLVFFYDQSFRYYFQFLHGILRFFLIIYSSFLVNAEVIDNLSILMKDCEPAQIPSYFRLVELLMLFTCFVFRGILIYKFM